jgi:hypothetical protein
MTAGIKANADGSGAIQVGGSDAITITSGLNTTFAGTVQASGVATNLYPLVAGAAQTAPPPVAQYFEFTSIPSWVDRITVMFNGVSTNGSAGFLIQLGDSGGIENTGYISGTTAISNGAVGSLVTSTAGFIVASGFSAANTFHGIVTINLLGSNIWVAGGSTYQAGTGTYVVAGSKTLSGTLDRIRITTTGSDNFDAGSVNILYE